MLQPRRTQCYFNYIENKKEAADPESVIGNEFRAKFRVPYSMFEEILQATRDSGKFSDDMVDSSGQKPHPLSLKMMLSLCKLALCVTVSSLEDICGINKAVLGKFGEMWDH